MAFSTLIRSAAPLIEGSRCDLSHFDSGVRGPEFCKASPVSVNRSLDSVRLDTSIFGTSVSCKSSSIQKCSARSIQPIRATATEMPPTVLKSRSSSKTKIGINGKLSYTFGLYDLICCLS
ncbi:glyceraldehyde-3-phosphate dehydrogenase GAPCP1, chloroplastic-like [Telopea speciosissima]|uniref:glyceraldehyde-3-phosphate dehydrogenase GAPCP1, chloroplastic-like n=1 Tax=Telopea speciosissima TaxID=54955 RepID=UPI001CC73A81|nr:glyceraldehyde-3-phosphate dehydrogenase GAPCP1, chloroplastic-like [Telopea speciosissima]